MEELLAPMEEVVLERDEKVWMYREKENRQEERLERKMKGMLLPMEKLVFTRENVKLWKSNGGKYPDPTKEEHSVMFDYARNYYFEALEFAPDESWRALEERARRCGVSELRLTLLNFLHQVRESKGYDVTYRLPFFGSPFIPMELPMKANHILYETIEEGKLAAIRGINARMQEESGKRYEFVSLDKLVKTTFLVYFFTITVKEVVGDVVMVDADADADAPEEEAETSKTVRAMLYDSFPMELVEWKFVV